MRLNLVNISSSSEGTFFSLLLYPNILCIKFTEKSKLFFQSFLPVADCPPPSTAYIQFYVSSHMHRQHLSWIWSNGFTVVIIHFSCSLLLALIDIEGESSFASLGMLLNFSAACLLIGNNAVLSMLHGTES